MGVWLYLGMPAVRHDRFAALGFMPFREPPPLERVANALAEVANALAEPLYVGLALAGCVAALLRRRRKSRRSDPGARRRRPPAHLKRR